MTKKEIKKELKILENKEYWKQKERVFEFIAIFKKANSVKWCNKQSGQEREIKKKGELFTCGTLIFSIADEDTVKEFYRQYRTDFLLKELEKMDKGVYNSNVEQLSLF